MNRFGSKSHPDWLFDDNQNSPASKLLAGFASSRTDTRVNVCVMIETDGRDGGSSLGSLFRHNAQVWNGLSLVDRRAVRETLLRITKV